MDCVIREMRWEEYELLSDFLYEAIYIPEGMEPPPKSVIECPELQEYIVGFGNRTHDKALVAEIQGNVVGAVWVRTMIIGTIASVRQYLLTVLRISLCSEWASIRLQSLHTDFPMERIYVRSMMYGEPAT